MGLTTYVSKLFESLAEPYRQAEFEDYEARDEILANEDLRSVRKQLVLSHLVILISRPPWNKILSGMLYSGYY